MSQGPKIFFIAPTGPDSGVTSLALGLVRAFQRQDLAVGFLKPVARPGGAGQLPDLASHFAHQLCQVELVEPLAFAKAEAMVRSDDLAALLEDVVAMADSLAGRYDVLVVEGLADDAATQIAGLLNAEIARALAADILLALPGGTLAALEGKGPPPAECVALAGHRLAGTHPERLAGLLINKVPMGLADGVPAAAAGGLPLLAVVPYRADLAAPRLRDVAGALGFAVERLGDSGRGVLDIVVASRSVEKIIPRLKAGALVVTAPDRADVILATALASLRGVPLAGLLLTCGESMPAPVAELIPPDWVETLAILRSDGDTFSTAARLARLDCPVAIDDDVRMERAIDHAADHIDVGALKSRIGEVRETRMSPAAFRHRLVQLARQAGRRIVLPEGDEPRTLAAAVAAQRRGIARCLLLGDPARIHRQAEALGLVIPADLEIVDPAAVSHRYVAPMVALRKSKGLTAEQAEEQLADTVVLGTMMLATGEVDGLVSGAVHTTANTVRPALQLIRTAEGSDIVSSIFFMLMPDEVLVYGDCAINPDPTAEQLATIAIQSAGSAKAFGIEPRVAMISYSTGTSGSGDAVDKVREATKIARARRPDLVIDGPMQYDAATVAAVARRKAPDSATAGRANVFVFPDLNTGNTTYKAVQRSANVLSVGPLLQGLRKPVNDLSRGALTEDILYTIALTAVQSTR